MTDINVILDPTTNVMYSSFYIKGLYEYFGFKKVRFGSYSKYFGGLKREIHTDCFDQYLAFLIIDRNRKIKVIIDYRDKNIIDKDAYEWCDKYFKVNTHFDEKREKVEAITPNFGINVWNLYYSIYFLIRNLLLSRLSVPTNLKKFIGVYYLSYKRPKLEDYYERVEVKENYIFSIATLWNRKNTLTSTNVWRKLFIELVKKNKNINFEGGFYALPRHPNYENYKSLIFDKRYSIWDYLLKTKKSQFVFNTPAVHNCHGWKLGEYLAMGKAIISTELSNKLPQPLINNESYHLIKTEDELSQAIEFINEDEKYRQKLEQGSKDYYQKNVAPYKVIQFIMNKLN